MKFSAAGLFRPAAENAHGSFLLTLLLSLLTS